MMSGCEVYFILWIKRIDTESIGFVEYGTGGIGGTNNRFPQKEREKAFVRHPFFTCPADGSALHFIHLHQPDVDSRGYCP